MERNDKQTTEEAVLIACIKALTKITDNVVTLQEVLGQGGDPGLTLDAIRLTVDDITRNILEVAPIVQALDVGYRAALDSDRKREFFKRCEAALRLPGTTSSVSELANLCTAHPDWYTEWARSKEEEA